MKTFLMILFLFSAKICASDILSDYIECLCLIHNINESSVNYNKGQDQRIWVGKMIGHMTSAKIEYFECKRLMESHINSQDSLEREISENCSILFKSIIFNIDQLIEVHEKYLNNEIEPGTFISKNYQIMSYMKKDIEDIVLIGTLIIAYIKIQNKTIVNRSELIEQIDGNFGTEIKVKDISRLSSVCFMGALLKQFLIAYSPN
jgi:hypothetical protein